VGGDQLDRAQDRLFRRNAAQLGRKTEVDTGRRDGITSDERQRIKDLEREVRELRRTNEILRKASAFFAQAELDRRPT
jgi:transposase-like protein